MLPASSPHIKAVLEEIQSSLQRVLGAKLRGLYLYGSLVTVRFRSQAEPAIQEFDKQTPRGASQKRKSSFVSEDFIDGVSDIDLCALLASGLSEAEFAALDEAHQSFAAAHPEWENRLEIAYLAEGALGTFREKRSPIAVISPGEPFHLKDAGIDWAINWYLLRKQGRALFGLPVEEVFPEISQAEFVEDLRAKALEWGNWVEKTRERVHYQSYAVITLSRALYAVRMGQQPSKRQAGDWVKNEYPQFAELIDWAFELRSMPAEKLPDPAESYQRVEAFVQFVIGEMVN